MLFPIIGLNIQHYPVNIGKQILFILGKIIIAVGIQQKSYALLFTELAKFSQEFRIKGTFSPGHGDSPDKGKILGSLLKHFLRTHPPNSGTGIVCADMNTLVAADTFFRREGHPSLLPINGLCGTARDAITAMDA